MKRTVSKCKQISSPPARYKWYGTEVMDNLYIMLIVWYIVGGLWITMRIILRGKTLWWPKFRASSCVLTQIANRHSYYKGCKHQGQKGRRVQVDYHILISMYTQVTEYVKD